MEPNILQQKISELPTNYKRALAQINLPEKLLNITKTESLNLDQIAEIEIEIMLSILGLRSSEDFVEKIIEKLEIDEDKAISITETVNNEIFLPIRKILRNSETEKEITFQKIETPEEILKHIEDGGLELPAPEKPEVVQPAPTQATEPATPRYTVDPYREAI